MKLLSIDIETTGLNPEKCSTLEFGAVLFTLAENQPGEKAPRWQTFERLIEHREITGEPYALQMNQKILAELAYVTETHIEIVPEGMLPFEFTKWLSQQGVTPSDKATIVGKNYDAFDRQFLERMVDWKRLVNPLVERRVLDVGSLFFNPENGKVQNLEGCLKTVGCDTVVSHRALQDALDCATAVSRFFS